MSDRGIFRSSLGGRYVTYIVGGDRIASQFGTIIHGGIWNSGAGPTSLITFRKSFRWWPLIALQAGYTYTYEPIFNLRTLCILLLGQSNAEGRGEEPDAPPIFHERILPDFYPYDENPSGPGFPFTVGPAIMLADKILDRGYYEAVYIVCTATGGQTVDDLYGTDGTDGRYRLQLDDTGVCGGPEGSNPSPIIDPADDLLVVYCQGEADAGASSVGTTWAARVTQLLDHATGIDFPSSNHIGTIVYKHPPSAPDNLVPSITHPQWPQLRTQEDLLENLTTAPYTVVVPMRDVDRQPADRVHIRTGVTDAIPDVGTGLDGWRFLTTDTVTRCVAVGMIQ